MSQPINQCDLPKILYSLKEREFFGKVTIEFNRGQRKLVRIEETRLVQNGENHHEQCNC